MTATTTKLAGGKALVWAAGALVAAANARLGAGMAVAIRNRLWKDSGG